MLHELRVQRSCACEGLTAALECAAAHGQQRVVRVNDDRCCRICMAAGAQPIGAGVET